MSPASSGSLEVERYIGACLITSQNQGRHKKPFAGDQQRFLGCNNPGNVENWAGGMPLFSYHQRWRRDTSYNPLSRLAVHTQGAPLILSNRYSNNKKKFANKSNTNKFFEHLGKPDLIGSNNNVSVAPDSISVTSDESSGSNNSETCLPRIIKPRKRRKKDRKPPPHLLRPINCQDGSYSTDSASPDVDLDSPQIISFVPYFTYLNHKSDPIESYADPTPNLHHSFEDLEDFDLNGNQTEGTCQCKYCDPTGQIWDIDRSCYSPYLTPPQSSNLLSKSCSSSLLDCFSSLSLDNRKAPSPNLVPKSSRDLEVSTEIVTSPNGHRDLEIRFFSQKRRTKEISRYEQNFADDVSVVNS
ncbi:hypothetical protein Trydic_g6626 [Trypoxylus dichotomus]